VCESARVEAFGPGFVQDRCVALQGPKREEKGRQRIAREGERETV